MSTREIDLTTIGGRLEDARRKAGLSRRQLGEKTNIPERTIEKFEYGELEPTIARTQVLATTLGIEFSYIINGETAPEMKTPMPNQKTVTDTTLQKLDILREVGFQKEWRRLPVLIEDARRELKVMDPAELWQIAESRGLQISHMKEGFNEALGDDLSEAHKICDEIEERILDTALLGIDLNSLKEDALDDLASDLELEGDEMGLFGIRSFSSSKAALSAIREELHSRLLDESMPNVTDAERYERKEAT